MVKRHKRRKFSGRVCEQIVYTVAGGADPKTSRPKKPRFQSQEEREEFKHQDLGREVRGARQRQLLSDQLLLHAHARFRA